MNKTIFASLLAASVVIADQLTKWWIRENVGFHDGFPVIDGLFNIVHARNPGGAFSFLANANESIRIPFFLATTIIAIGALFYFLRQLQASQRILQFAIGGILGGAVGNLIDRIVFGYVTDFLDVYWGEAHWPAFNVADSFITTGVVILCVHSLFFAEPAPNSPVQKHEGPGGRPPGPVV